MTIEETVNELDELAMYVEHAFTEEHKRKSFDALQMAIKALEKQIPKEPIPQDEDCLECPNCDSFIGYASECKDEHYRVEYCPNCGQAIDWGNENGRNNKS